MLPSKFTVRVYGLLERNNTFLISKELIQSKHYYKFVGGGLEFGESISEALIREFQEELQIEIEIHEQLFITDSYVQSSFDSNCQVLCVYFSIKTKDAINSLSLQEALEIKLDKKSKDQIVFWCPKNKLLDILDLETDKEFAINTIL